MASSQQQFNDAIYQDIVSKYKELSTPQSYDLDKALRDRAKAVLPSLTHLDVKGMMAPGYAQFFVSGKGARVTDVNKKEYIDYMCSYGPMLVGYNNPVVNEAIRKQLELGDVLTGPSPRMVELAELITETIPWADWCFFAKNGSDATFLAVRMARAYTRKKIILRAPGSYHGSASIWQEGKDARLRRQGVLPEEKSSVFTYYFNDLNSVIEAFDNAKGDVAAIIVAAFRWDYGQAQEICSAEFLQGVRKLCDDNGALLICDDVRSAYRISPEGTWEDKRYGHGVQPDLSCLCKGIANGQPLSVVVGNAKCRKGAENISATGSFWANSVPFASALATIPLAKAGAKKSEKMGMLLRDGLKSQANSFKSLANDFVQTGPPQMPYFHFQSESKFPLPNRHKILIFCAVCVANGVWIHPFHTNFLSSAHTEKDIHETLHVTQEAFSIVDRYCRRCAARPIDDNLFAEGIVEDFNEAVRSKL